MINSKISNMPWEQKIVKAMFRKEAADPWRVNKAKNKVDLQISNIIIITGVKQTIKVVLFVIKQARNWIGRSF
jgi:hypothetical protein